MSEQSAETDPAPASRMGKAITRGVLIAIPTAIVGITFAVWGITDLGLAESATTALLPGVLFGGFSGGFVGVARTMD